MTTGAGKGRAVAALFLLSLLWAFDGLGPDLLPALRRSPMPAMERQAITYGLVALLAAAFARKKRAKLPGGRIAAAWTGIGLLLFAAPVMLSAVAQNEISQLERVAIFSLTPVLAVVLEPHLGNSSQRSAGALIAALAAVAGALCIFPLDVPGTPVAAAAALATVMAVACAAIGNCFAVRCATSGSNSLWTMSAALACGAGAIAFAVASTCTEQAKWTLPNGLQSARLALIDVPALMLLFWLLGRMSAVRMTTRYLLAPLITVLAGIALEQPAITTRMILGTGLMGAGVVWLLVAPDEDINASSIGM
jgi:drug/metabolite transporter (DMT)-like permease